MNMNFPVKISPPPRPIMFERAMCKGVKTETFITDLGEQTVLIDNPEIEEWLNEHAPGWRSSDNRLFIYIPDKNAAFHFKLRWL